MIMTLFLDQMDVNDVDKQREETILPSLIQSIHYCTYMYTYTIHCLSMNCYAFVESSPLHTLKSVDKEDTIRYGLSSCNLINGIIMHVTFSALRKHLSG